MSNEELVAKLSESIYQFCRTNMYLRKQIPVTNAEMGTLIYIYTKRSDGAPTASQVAEYFDISRSSITSIISKLESKCYLEKCDDVIDKRKSYLMLTEKGVMLIESHLEAFNKKTMEIIENLGSHTAEDLVSLLDKMTAILKKE